MFSIGVLSSYDGLGCLRYLRIRTIFNILNVLTKVHFVQFATFQQPEHKRQILGREVTFCLEPIASFHSDMSETSPYGYIVHINSAVRKELFSSRTLRVSPSICSA